MQPSRRRNWLLLLLVLSMGVFWWFSSGDKSDEDQVRAAIHQVAEGAEDGDLNHTMEPFSDNYSDEDGADRSAIYGFLWQQYQKRGPIEVLLGPIDVTVDGQHAWASFEVALVEGIDGSQFYWPVGVDALNFEVELAKEGGDWKISSHSRSSYVSP